MVVLSINNLCSIVATGKISTHQDWCRGGFSRKQGDPSYSLDNADEKTFSTDFLTDRCIEFINEPKTARFWPL